MTTVQAGLPVDYRVGRLAHALAGAMLVAGVVALRASNVHEGLLYPDGYQYLLMARGIADGLEPVTSLGPGGDVFAPNADAAVKPFFPALVALASALGVSALEAARAVTFLAGVAVPMLTALLALRLGAGRVGAAVAALVCAVSPTLVYWSGYAGPDPVAQALALGAALLLLYRRPVAGGAVAAMCVLTRPEYALAALAALAAAGVVRSLRRDAVRAAAAGAFVVAVGLAIARPEAGLPSATSIAGGVALIVLAAVVLVLAGRLSPIASACVVAAMVLPVVLVDDGAWLAVAEDDWPLLALAACGVALCLRFETSRPTALRILALSFPLAVVYWVKNPELARYAAQLVPELALLGALGVGTLGRARSTAAAGAAALVAVGALLASQPAVGSDNFQELAPKLAKAPPGVLVTAAPDAFGFLLPDRPVRTLQAGAEGLVLVDGAARAYAPGLKVDGRLIRRIDVITGFLRPDGTIDTLPARLYRGRVRP
jgi:hypothetical protein